MERSRGPQCEGRGGGRGCWARSQGGRYGPLLSLLVDEGRRPHSLYTRRHSREVAGAPATTALTLTEGGLYVWRRHDEEHKLGSQGLRPRCAGGVSFTPLGAARHGVPARARAPRARRGAAALQAAPLMSQITPSRCRWWSAACPAPCRPARPRARFPPTPARLAASCPPPGAASRTSARSLVARSLSGALNPGR